MLGTDNRPFYILILDNYWFAYVIATSLKEDAFIDLLFMGLRCFVLPWDSMVITKNRFFYEKSILINNFACCFIITKYSHRI